MEDQHKNATFILFAISLFTVLLTPINAIFIKGQLTVHEVKMVKNKIHANRGQSIEADTLIASQGPNNSPRGCITYSSLTHTIVVSCRSTTTLSDVAAILGDSAILERQNPSGVWLLNANLVIAKGALFSIDSKDTKWLKISSELANPSVMTHPYSIDVHGTLNIDSVKITSWDPRTNYYSITNGSREAVAPGTRGATSNGYIIHLGAPRPFIKVEHDATGTTNITNSEIAYLGYESGSTSNVGSGGLNYYGGNGSLISGNSIHDLYFGFYSSGVSFLVLQGNQVYNNANYGLDPHTGTHDMVIRYNLVHDNGAQGIICSLNCYNILIENNRLYHNDKAGMMFSRNMINSVARNNVISNEVGGILVSQSNNNRIYNNTISNSQYGISVAFGSSGNRFYSNTIENCTHFGISSQDPKSSGVQNIFYNNRIINSPSTSNHSTGMFGTNDLNQNTMARSHHRHH